MNRDFLPLATSDRMLTAVAWLSVAACALLLALRAASAISFGEPLFAITSGAEEDSALAFWKFIEGRAVFQDPHRFPFVASAYNWLYYAFYGAVIGGVLAALGLGIEWLPTIGRFVSLGWVVLGCVATYVIVRRIGPRAGAGARQLAPMTVFLFIGPLVGFWAISLNVELAAMVAAVAGAGVVCLHYDRYPRAAVVAACLCALLAWGFKQSHIFLAGSLMLFLLSRRDWRGLVLAAIVLGTVWGAATIAGPEAYVKMLFFKGTDKTLEFWQFRRNLINFAVKTTPFWMVAGLLVFMAFRDPRLRNTLLGDTAAQFLISALCVTLPLTLVMSAKQGAAENYYFVVTAMLFLFSARVVGLAGSERMEQMNWRPVLAVGWVLSIVAVGTVLAGLNGRISVRHWHDRNTVERQCVDKLPGPLLPLNNLYLSLPWMTASEPRFNIFFNYGRDRAAGRVFERDGLAGLVREGYFATIILGAGNEPVVDGETLNGRYRQIPFECPSGTMAIYLRNGLEDPLAP
ncbi:MAG: hypothetical protein OXR84_16050 [Magnetovibrio sp.]|nr:hypothetical protein [Magnetovibrio sp.]